MGSLGEGCHKQILASSLKEAEVLTICIHTGIVWEVAIQPAKAMGSQEGQRASADAARSSLERGATIDSLASSIEERKISDGSSIPPVGSSLPQSLTPRTAALLLHVSEAAPGPQTSRLKPAGTEPSKDISNGAAHISGSLSAEGLAATNEDTSVSPVGQSAKALGTTEHAVAESPPSTPAASTTSVGAAQKRLPSQHYALGPPEAAAPDTHTADPLAEHESGLSSPAAEHGPASPQKRPLKSAAQSRFEPEEPRPDSPKRQRTIGRPFSPPVQPSSS